MYRYSTVDKLVQKYVFIPEKYKDCYLTYLLNEFSGTLYNSLYAHVNLPLKKCKHTQ